MKKIKTSEIVNIPNHVGIIMDGNGRWAKKRLMPRSYGHKVGAERFLCAVEGALKYKVRHLTLYAFYHSGHC